MGLIVFAGSNDGWLVVLGVNVTLTAKVIIIMAVGDALMFPAFHTPLLTLISVQSHRLLFSHSAQVRGENTPERSFASTGSRNHNKQPGHESDALTTEPPGRGAGSKDYVSISHFDISRNFSLF